MTATASIDLLPEASKFVYSGPHKAIIGGKEVESSNGETFETRDPGSGEKLADVYNMQPDDVDRAVKAAQEAFDNSGWSTMLPTA